MVRYSGDRLTPAVRKEIGLKAKNGVTKVKLARDYTVSRAVVKRWAAEALKAVPDWEDAYRSGRPGKLTAAERSKAKRQARSRQRVNKITSNINQQRSDPVSTATVRRVIVSGESGLRWLPLSRGRRLSDKNRSDRFEFCQEHESAQTGAWLYGDSKYFYLYPDGSGSLQWAWQEPDQKEQLSSCSNPIVLHVYAVVGKSFKSELEFVAPSPPPGSKAKKANQNFTGQCFVEAAKVLHKQIRAAGKDNARHPVVLDRAKQHTSGSTKEALSDMGFHYKQDFPAQSWDINIIENVWGVLETKLQQMRGRFPTTPDGWRRRLRDAWAQVEQSTIDKLVSSVKGRIREIVQLEGAWLYKHGSKGK